MQVKNQHLKKPKQFFSEATFKTLALLAKKYLNLYGSFRFNIKTSPTSQQNPPLTPAPPESSFFSLSRRRDRERRSRSWPKKYFDVGMFDDFCSFNHLGFLFGYSTEIFDVSTNFCFVFFVWRWSWIFSEDEKVVSRLGCLESGQVIVIVIKKMKTIWHNGENQCVVKITTPGAPKW